MLLLGYLNNVGKKRGGLAITELMGLGGGAIHVNVEAPNAKTLIHVLQNVRIYLNYFL